MKHTNFGRGLMGLLNRVRCLLGFHAPGEWLEGKYARVRHCTRCATCTHYEHTMTPQIRSVSYPIENNPKFADQYDVLKRNEN